MTMTRLLRRTYAAILAGCLSAFVAQSVEAQGTYTGLQTTPVGNAPSAVKNIDFDQDGDQDLVVANSLDNNFSVLTNDGNGNLTVVGSFPCGISPVGLVITDFDQNGTLDVATSNIGSDDVTVMLSNGSGFSAPISIATGQDPFGMVVADLDGDTDTDIITTNFASNNLTVLFNLGGGMFSTVTTPFLGAAPSGIVVTDLDRDSDLDIAIAFTGFGVVGVYGRAANGSYGFDGFLSVGVGPFDLVAVDLNYDGLPELATCNIISNNVTVLRNLGQRTFAPAAAYTVGNRPIRLAKTNANNSLGVDLATVDFNDFAVRTLLNTSNSTLTPVSPSNLIALTPSSLVSCDMNGDFYDDFVVTSVSQDSVAVIFNQPPVNPYPGTNEDLILATGVNAPVSSGPGNFIKSARTGDQLAIAVLSPGLGLSGTATAVGAQLVQDGFPPVPGVPNLWLNSFGFAAVVVYFTNSLSPSGESFVVTLPPGLTGFSIITQAFAYTPSAANGIVTTTDAYEFKLIP